MLILFTNDEKIMSHNHKMAAIENAMIDMTSPLGNKFVSLASRKNSTAFTIHAMSIEHHIVIENNITVISWQFLLSGSH